MSKIGKSATAILFISVIVILGLSMVVKFFTKENIREVTIRKIEILGICEETSKKEDKSKTKKQIV